MKKFIEELEGAIVTSQPFAKKLAAAGAPHGLKADHKFFWETVYVHIQIAAERLMQAARVYQDQYQPNLPFTDEEFVKWWGMYLAAFLEQHDYPMPPARMETQLDLIAKLYQTSPEAVSALKYFINKGYYHIFKLKTTAENGTTREPGTEIYTEDYYKQQ